MRDNKKITALILILIFIFTATAAVGAQGRINDMNFKNADLTDVLRAIAEVANVNLITDSTVSGTVTVHLKDISFEKALDLITQTRSLTYKWDENTVVVAPPDRIDQIYANIVTEFVPINSNDMESISVIVRDIFPETQITSDSVRRQFILKGEEARVREIKEMINRLDSSAVVQEREEAEIAQAEAEIAEKEEEKEKRYTDSYQVINAEMADLTDKLTNINPELAIRSNPLTNKIIISGTKDDVESAISMVATYDESLEPETRNIRVDYVDTEQITEIVGKFYPDIKLHVNAKRKEIIINGAKNKLNGVVELVEEINKPQQQVIIETRVEEISTESLEDFGIDLSSDMLSRIHFIKDSSDPSLADADGAEFGQIEGIELTWPNFFRAIENDGTSKTLANPRLMTLNGEEAQMSIIDEVPSPNFDEDGNIRSYDYERAGIELTFTPWITQNNEIELKINPSVSSFGANPPGPEPPSRKTRSVDTRLRLEDGETFAIGGLIQEDEIESMSKVPFLSEIPLIGEIFKSRSGETNKTELVILVTPRIINYGGTVYADNSAEINQNGETVADESNKLDQQDEEEQTDDHAKNRDEVLAKYKNDEEKEFNELSPEELQEILNNN
ncbi:general secretion pathway protein D [Halanaerobium saccharolyticum]|uniref:General secretion pathway protein D n=1 Tax=Halanaerobium saccharolyticum TaxID=43595 RepID=A0A4R6SBV3_9FIRM|nr:type II and III secretion system protein [Halanaerobium saccharolyticum]TDP96957.1 general secretion pathway protein D [Halanaerobium saccharolyticum]